MSKKKSIMAGLLAAAMIAGTNAAFAQHTGSFGYGSEWSGYTSANAASFKDVPETHWARENIDRAVAKKWFDGYPDGTFHPDASISRAEAMTVFVNFLGLQLKNTDESSYYDVKTTDWYSPYIETGKKLFPQITTYNGQKPFQPEMPMTREDTVYALVTALRYTDDTINADQSVLNMFKDKNSISELIKPYMAVAVKKEIVAGYDDGTIGAQDPLTRAEFATLLYRASFVGMGSSELNFDDDEAVVREVTVTPSGTYHMQVGDVFNISAFAKMSDGTITDYSANLSPKAAHDKITVSGRTVTAVAPGTDEIRFLNDSKLSDTVITVVVSEPTEAPVFEYVNIGDFLPDYKVVIEGKVSDPNNAALTLDMDGVNVAIINGKFEKTVQLEEGLNTFIFTLKNSYNMTATEQVKIERGEDLTVVAYKWSVDSIELNAGETASVKLLEVYDNGTSRDVTSKFSLTSSNTSVAKVDSRGNITAVSAGSAKINFSSQGIGASISMPRPLSVTVKGSTETAQLDQNAVVTAYEWSVDSIELEAGESASVKLFEVYSNGDKKDVTSKFNLSSTDTSVAVVSGGKITAVKPGSAKISFSSGVGATVSMPRPLKVTVKAGEQQEAELTGLQWSADSLAVSAGSTANIKLYGIYSDGTKKDLTEECGVYSDDEDVAVVSGNTVRGIKEGSTELWFSSVPKANLTMPGMIKVTVTD